MIGQDSLIECCDDGADLHRNVVVLNRNADAETIQNVRVREKIPFAQVPEIQQAIEGAERELNGNGRVVVRYSGTEALARVMVEAESEARMRALAGAIASAIQRTLGI